jgi:hypothetical protein
VLGGSSFDLNIEEVLEHWPVASAIREFIANALDERALTGTAEPVIEKVAEGQWRIADFGRGLHYQHLTQKENPEKLTNAAVIGQFGIGLKDALAVCDRRGVGVDIRSRHGDITTARLPKRGFAEVITLHAVVTVPSDPDRTGTEIVLTGVADDDIDRAKSFFLRYSGTSTLESTRYGDVLARESEAGAGHVYVKGLLVSDEPNFLFSYNITNPNAKLRRALNRERTNVGRGAYSDRVKDILKECKGADVAAPLTADLGRFASGGLHDELSWKDVALHACRVLQTRQKVVFVTPWQLGSASVAYARNDGYRPVVVPGDIAKALAALTDVDGRPMFDLNAYRAEWNESFTFDFVAPGDLRPKERAVYALTGAVATLAQIDLEEHGVSEVRISETMRLNEQGAEIVGVWEPANKRIVVRRDQLVSASAYCGILLHELEHAVTGFSDGTLAFEEALTARLGIVASVAVAFGAVTTSTSAGARAIGNVARDSASGDGS